MCFIYSADNLTYFIKFILIHKIEILTYFYLQEYLTIIVLDNKMLLLTITHNREKKTLPPFHNKELYSIL